MRGIRAIINAALVATLLKPMLRRVYRQMAQGGQGVHRSDDRHPRSGAAGDGAVRAARIRGIEPAADVR